MNYEDLIPSLNDEYKWELTDEKNVVVYVIHKGLFHAFAGKFFKKPKVSEVELDEYGSYVWHKIDGIRSINDISKDIIKDFGEEANLAIQRLVMFMQMLRTHHMISLNKIPNSG